MDLAEVLRMATFAISISISVFMNVFPGTEGIGVNYGMLGDNLPSPAKVISLYKARNITSLRLFNPNSTVLSALQNSDIDVILGTYNQDLQNLASNKSFASQWVAANVLPYAKIVNFRYICVGNEVIPGDLAPFVLPAMKNLGDAMKDANVGGLVSTAVSSQVLGSSYPPSNGSFSGEAESTMTPIVQFLEENNSPLLVNIYPYFAYSGPNIICITDMEVMISAGDPQNVRLDYALFMANGTVVQDGPLGYANLFDSIVDAAYSALERAGGPGVPIVVSETGWPSGGDGAGATVGNAEIYNNNVVRHVESGRGTPRRPGRPIETYLFAMFNENQKPAGAEQNFGLYRPDMTEVYHVDFTP